VKRSPPFLEINMVGIVFKLSYVVKEIIGLKGKRGQRDLVEEGNDRRLKYMAGGK